MEDLKNKKTDSALRWANQNQRQLQANNGSNFIFMLHQVNYRSMLQKAVDIHFYLNYKHLCPQLSEPNDGAGEAQGGSPTKAKEPSKDKPPQEELKSSLIDDTNEKGEH